MSDQILKSTLIFGGARSGKSSFAEHLCEETDCDLTYIATSPRFENDPEMAKRIQHHIDRRGERWTVFEEEIDLAAAISKVDKASNVILIDCMTLWLNNLIYHKCDIDAARDSLSNILATLEARIVFISNEVGQGIVPEHRESRLFRDEQGLLNQWLAFKCDRVIEVRAGLPLLLKPSPQPVIKL